MEENFLQWVEQHPVLVGSLVTALLAVLGWIFSFLRKEDKSLNVHQKAGNNSQNVQGGNITINNYDGHNKD